MKKNLFMLTVFSLMTVATVMARPGGADHIRLRGYLKVMPGLRLDRDFSDPGFNNIIHHRLNARWDISDNLNLHLEGRNRLIYNDMFDMVPNIRDIFDQDDGLVDMSWVWLSDGNLIGHSEIDRLYLGWRTDNWRVRVGRQRINWGINLVSNPNDLFNTYSFFDFDYVERPGTDAVRVQHYLGGLSGIEFAVSPARNNREMVAATRFFHNLRGYDLQAIAGYYRDRLALGGGWAGHIGGAGFKGEATWFYDLEETGGVDRGNFVGAVGLDYMFPRGTFCVVEFLYNGGDGRVADQAFLITEPLRPDNIMFSEYAITLSADHAFSPIISGGIAVMSLPDIGGFFLMPQMQYSLAQNLDAGFIAQLFTGGSGTIFEEAGSAWFISVTYSY